MQAKSWPCSPAGVFVLHQPSLNRTAQSLRTMASLRAERARNGLEPMSGDGAIPRVEIGSGSSSNSSNSSSSSTTTSGAASTFAVPSGLREIWPLKASRFRCRARCFGRAYLVRLNPLTATSLPRERRVWKNLW